MALIAYSLDRSVERFERTAESLAHPLRRLKTELETLKNQSVLTAQTEAIVVMWLTSLENQAHHICEQLDILAQYLEVHERPKS